MTVPIKSMGSVQKDFVSFIDGAELIIHNAPFDVGFLDAEFRKLKWNKVLAQHCSIFDTLVYAREKHPGLRNNLDALCKRYSIYHANRDLHGALLDAEILALVYLAMTGGQTELFAPEHLLDTQSEKKRVFAPLTSSSPVLLASDDELAIHDAFIATFKKT